MGLSIWLTATRPTTVFDTHITHNLGRMADAAGIYQHIWHPDDHLGIETAEELIVPLAAGLARLKADPEKFKAFDAPNGWGVYEDFVRFVTEYLQACRENPDATITVSL